MKNKKIYKIIKIVLIILLVLTSGFLLYNLVKFQELEKFYILMGSVLISYIVLFIIFTFGKSFRKNSLKSFFMTSIFSLIFTIVFGIGGYLIYTVYGALDNFNKTVITYTSSLITLDSKFSDFSKISDSKIGIVNDSEDIELYELPMKVIADKKLEESNEIVKYNSTIELMQALYDEEVNLIFINGNYKDLFASFEEYSDLEEKVIEVNTSTKEVEKIDTESEITDSSNISVTEPFTILLMGVDSTASTLNKNAAFNGDTLLLVTFNPKTLNATMFSIPRDTYVKIACGNRQVQKINTSAYGGSSCVIKTIQNLTGIKIDYYAKINFKGAVDLVNALGGIDVKVPYSFCEQNSKRQWGSNTVFVYEGNQTLNGEQALALARNRHYPKNSASMRKYCPTLTGGTRNDFVRGKNQQLVVEGMLNKVKTINSANTLMEILDAVSKNVDTNLSTDQILSFYDIIKTILSAKSLDVVNIQKTFLRGYDMRVYEPSAKAERYAFFNWEGSLDDIVEAMEINLGKKSHSTTKEFSFSADKTYTKTIVGDKSYNEAKVKTVPNFSGYTYSQAKSWGSSNNMTINFYDNDTKEQLTSLTNYTFVSQSVHEKTLVIKAGNTVNLYYKAKVSAPIVEVDEVEEDGTETE